ncbi:hypothetical protein JCM8208_003589 [Rhodotorula glutinis]
MSPRPHSIRRSSLELPTFEYSTMSATAPTDRDSLSTSTWMTPVRPTLRRLSSRSTRTPSSTTPLDEIDEPPFSINATPPLNSPHARLAESGASTWSASPPPSSRQSLWGRVLGMKRYRTSLKSFKQSRGGSEVDGGSTPTGSILFPPTSSRPTSSAPTTAALSSDDEPHLFSFPFPYMPPSSASHDAQPSSPLAHEPLRRPRPPLVAARPWLDASGRALTPVSSGSESTPSPGSTASDESRSRSRGSFTPSLPRVQEGVAFPPSPVAVARASQQMPPRDKVKQVGRGRSRRRRIETGSRGSSSASGGDEASTASTGAGGPSKKVKVPALSTTRRSDSSRSLAELIADDARDYSSSSSDSQPSSRNRAPQISPVSPREEYERLFEPSRATSGNSSSGTGSDWPPRGLTSHFSDWTPTPTDSSLNASGSSRNASGSRGRSSLNQTSAPADDAMFGAVPAVLERGPHPRPGAHARQAPTALVIEPNIDKATSSSLESVVDKAAKRSRTSLRLSASADAPVVVDDGHRSSTVSCSSSEAGTVREGVGDAAG